MTDSPGGRDVRLKALSLRDRVLFTLDDQEYITAYELSRRLNAATEVVSNHLLSLMRAGQAERRGRLGGRRAGVYRRTTEGTKHLQTVERRLNARSA